MMRFSEIIYLIIFILIFPFYASAVNHYVDKNASGQNNGTSWANAWQSFSAINWNLIQPGDKVYISGGSDSTIYYEQLTVGKSGTAANPINMIAGKDSPSPSGHSGRVIIDGGGTRTQSINVQNRSYIILKGFECRHATRGINVEDDINGVIIDSMYIYNYYGQAGIMLNGNQTTYSVDSVTIRNCSIVSFDNYPGQTDGIYIQGAQHTVIHDNYVRIPNQDPDAHNDALQAYHSNGFMIYNNVFINDSVYSLQGGGIPIILGSEGSNPVIIYNNFIYMGGIWHPNGNIGGALCTRWYNVNQMPPTWIIHNTIVVNGPRCRGVWQQYPATCVNNIIAMFSTAGGMSNMEVGELPSAAIVDSLRNNLFWRNWAGPGFSGQYTGNGNTGTVSGWTNWVNTYGGTGVNSNPLFLYDFRESNGYVIKSNSPSRNAGEDLRTLIESFGLPWTDIDGNLRDNSPDIGAYQYSSGSDITFSLSVDVNNHWNMVSVPGINPDGMGVNTWWAYRDMSTNVFRHSNGYQPVTTTTPGIGYWMRHSGNRIYNTGDEWPATGIQKVAHAPLNGTSGWNLIGGYELSVAAAGVTTNPPGLQSGPIFKFSTGYLPAATINPGYGYWINLSAAGQIIIPETLAKEEEPKEWFPENWGKIILTDAIETAYTLYAVKGEVDLSQYQLPPSPLEGMFDIRFSSGRIAEVLDDTEKTIEMSGINYPLRVKVENMDITLKDEFGKEVNTTLRNGEELIISNNSINRLKIVSSQFLNPVEYSLEQNYPNPFNPSTKIRYQLPKETKVTIKIYDILGAEVISLVNEKKEPGYYEVELNGKDLSSGIYFYRMMASDLSSGSGQVFVETKKMILLR